MILKFKDKYTGELKDIDTEDIGGIGSGSATLYAEDTTEKDSWVKIRFKSSDDVLTINESIDDLFVYAFAMGYRRGSEETLEKLKWKTREALNENSL